MKKIIFFAILFLLAFSFVFAEQKEGIQDKIREFFSLFLDILIKFFQLIQEFFGLIVKLLLWLKQQIS